MVAVSLASRVWWCFRCAARGKRCGRRRAPRKRAARGAAVVAPGSSSVRAVESTRTSASEAVEVCDALADSRAAVGDGAVGGGGGARACRVVDGEVSSAQRRQRTAAGLGSLRSPLAPTRPSAPPRSRRPQAHATCDVEYSVCETCPTPLRVWTAAACATMLPAEPFSNHHESVAR